MLEKKEVACFILAGLVIGYLFAFKGLLAGSFLVWLKLSAYAFLMILAAGMATEIASAKFGCDAEFKLWSFDIRFKKKSGLRKAKPWFIPGWLILPLGLIILSYGYIKWLAVIAFEAVPATRLEKKYIELTEWELALIALVGPFVSLLLAVISQLIGWETFASMNILYALFNLLPLHELNGAKIFFGSMMLWIFSFIFAAIIFILLGITNITTTLIAAAVLGVSLVILFYFLHEAK